MLPEPPTKFDFTCATTGTKLQRMQGLTPFLHWLDDRGLRKAAVTNAPRDNTLLMLNALKLDSYFEAVVLGEDCERAKPHPDPYTKALQLLGLQPHEAVAIEDSPSGGSHQGGAYSSGLALRGRA